ncbi:MAG TPA: hypothetical protein VME01_03770 [Solirubrobacteraceae bacterium]|nr:hypothetical protein [Solirubrobacteraceae bacterium]
MNGPRQLRTDGQAPRGIGARVAGFAYVALLPPAAFAVHQLRYWLAYGSRAGIELERTGHSYLHSVVPWLILLLALTIGVFLRALGRAFAGHRSPARFTLSLTAMWLVCSAALVAIFASQEFLEGLFATGHPAGWAGIFGYGGWWAIPAALSIGLVLATLLHGARWLVREVAHRRTRPYLTAIGLAPRVACRPRDAVLGRRAPLVAGWSGRGPPTLD